MKRMKDIPMEDLRQFLRKMVWVKSTGRGDLMETTQEFWSNLVVPEIDDIFSVARFNFKRNPEDIIAEDIVIINIALAIAITLEVKRQIRNGSGLDFWNNVTDPEKVLKRCEANPKFAEKVQLIGQEIAPNVISWLHAERYVVETELSKVNYKALDEFLRELMEIKKTKETKDNQIIIDASLDSLELTFNLVARRSRLEKKTEELNPENFISEIIKNLALGSIAKQSVEFIAKAGLGNPFDGSKEREYYQKAYQNSMDYFNYLKNLLAPGLIWWVKENFSTHPEVKLEDITTVFDDYSEESNTRTV